MFLPEGNYYAKMFSYNILQYVPEGSGSWKYNHYFPVAEGEGKTFLVSPSIIAVKRENLMILVSSRFHDSGDSRPHHHPEPAGGGGPGPRSVRPECEQGQQHVTHTGHGSPSLKFPNPQVLFPDTCQ